MTSPMPELLDHVVTGSIVDGLVLDGTKIGFWRDRVEAWKRGERIAPVTMDIALTRRCQASCSFCYATGQASDFGGEITEEIAFDFFDDAAEIGVKGISLISDGESTMVPYYVDAIQYAHNCGIKIGVGSNGIALTRPVLERILPYISYLRFNFSAGERKRYAEIMGVKQVFYDKVLQNIRDAMDIIRRDKLPVSCNMQLVCMPQDGDQLLPFARLVKSIRPTYGIIKHCADSKDAHIGVDYSKYKALHDTFRECEALSDDELKIVVKWSRIENEGKRNYSRCYGPPFLLQMSGSGLISTCGFHFNSKHTKFHMGYIAGPEKKRFKDIFHSDRYWDIISYLASDEWDSRERCGPNCLQTSTNQWLFDHVNGKVDFPVGAQPRDLEFL
jgi:MoaA/NifB/PqqE/SkfB family radical SAM enzyme